MSTVTRKQLVVHTAVAGSIAGLAFLLWILSATTQAHWIPEYATCARLGSVALMISAGVWAAIGWLSHLPNR